MPHSSVGAGGALLHSDAVTTPTYVLGTGLSHDGSAVLLRDGVVAVGIEKERVTRQKHDGGNDADAIAYCLDAEGITLDDVSVAVQCGLFGIPDRDDHHGPRPFADSAVPLVSISHHLAHAYSTVGTCPYDAFDILVVDGCGSPVAECVDAAPQPAGPWTEPGFDGADTWCEKDSWYRWDGASLTPLWKDHSEFADRWLHDVRLPTTAHSIGGFYAAISRLAFGSLDDAGKLMGLAPYGDAPLLDERAFEWRDDRLFVTDTWRSKLGRRSRDDDDLRDRFDHFAALARWAQDEVAGAVIELIRSRRAQFGDDLPLAYSGGVALNAVANGTLLAEGVVDRLYVEPAAGDNGIALGCAYYGWLATLGRERVPHDRSTCFGRAYGADEIDAAVAALDPATVTVDRPGEGLFASVADDLAAGRIVGWFQGGAEFGPRALGRRSLLADPGVAGMADRINHRVKRREDYRPFAPAVLATDVHTYFEGGWESPYMILVDRVRPEWRDALANVIHRDNSARVQTVEADWNPAFASLLDAVRARTGVGVVLNTSFNERGQPIVETPAEAVALFERADIDVLVLDDVVVRTR